MIEFLSNWGLFLAKTLTIMGVLIALIVIIMLIAKGLREKLDEGTLVVTNLNKKYDEVTELINDHILTGAACKAAHKKLKQQAKAQKKEEKKQVQNDTYQTSPCLFVTRFTGDIRASDVASLRECITAIISVATPQDEVCIILESAGGYVHSYGLAASQLERIRSRNIPLTVAIDKCAASGGYLMACVANKIMAAPFAIVGSIGVIAQMPNFHRLLEKNDIDFELHTAGHYKRTLTLFGENTDAGREKFVEELNATHALFQSFVKTHRPSLDIAKIATGEHWHAKEALELGLVDQLLTSDDYLLSKHPEKRIFELSYEIKESLVERLGFQVSKSIVGFIEMALLKLPFFQKPIA